MREILFRGKRVDNGEWVEGYYASQSNYSCTNRKNIHFILKDECRDIGMGGLEYYEVDPETVGQYTGLTDKNGTKIFEGDIVKFIHKNKLKPYDDFDFPFFEPYSRNYKIEYINTFVSYGLRFINGSIHFPCKQSTLLTHDCEIIGNIYENPELLGEPMKPVTENFELLEG